MSKKYFFSVLATLLSLLSFSVRAGEVEIEKVVIQKTGDSWTFEVTLKHGDTGWKHYANAWRVLNESGKVIKTRVLFHPHVDEQPFTRSMSGVVIPQGDKSVSVEARDKVHGWSKAKVVIDLKRDKGSRYLIRR